MDDKERRALENFRRDLEQLLELIYKSDLWSPNLTEEQALANLRKRDKDEEDESVG